MRKLLRPYLPSPEKLQDQAWSRYFGSSILHPRLWHLNRHSAAGGVAVGLFCGLIPGPLQMLGAAILSVIFKVNLPLALVCTLFSNPLTIVPLYLLAYKLGTLVIDDGGKGFTHPPERGDLELLQWGQALGDWVVGLGPPLALGLAMLAAILAAAGYLVVSLGWRIYLIRALRRRKRARAARGR
ncbi:DUF2062 domain-containing protein [Uliginosibacterium sp. H1]|uniref:DUF2062 domain-containing protein n=1 Tax=Uliginosibacterium sp. H1 TaxID=3114757 RepID=UPI002E195EE3|nr:DUF2062 domain-containing protein [Uliginosibacterium sp. H1]